MIWETNPKKRNENNIVKFYIKSSTIVNAGDLLIGEYNEYFVSNYEITEVIERREGLVKNKDYVIAKTIWKRSFPKFAEFNLNTNFSFNKLFNLN